MTLSRTSAHLLILNNGINHCTTALTRQEVQGLWAQTSTHPSLSSSPVLSVATCPPQPSWKPHFFSPCPHHPTLSLQSSDYHTASHPAGPLRVSSALELTETAPLSRAVMSKLLLREPQSFYDLIPTVLLTSGSSLIIHLVLLTLNLVSQISKVLYASLSFSCWFLKFGLPSPFCTPGHSAARSLDPRPHSLHTTKIPVFTDISALQGLTPSSDTRYINTNCVTNSDQ